MSEQDTRAAESNPVKPIIIVGLLGFVLALRLAHLSSAVLNPLSYQQGPDEQYYLRFGQAVLSGHGQNAAEFTFMDPAYGYLLGAIFRMVGVSPFTILALQCVLDTATAFGILYAGRLLGRPRAGVWGALLYALCATAIMYSTALLKEVWVTCFVTWWVVCALQVIRSQRREVWLAFGVYCGIGIGFRSTLSLLGIAGLLLPLMAARGVWKDLGSKTLQSAAVVVGLLLAVLPWSVRNHQAYDSWSFLPHNGGIVLHQAYNAQNPDSSIWIPDFVNYLEPAEIWRGYAAEAERRSGTPLSVPDVDRYWKAQGFSFMTDHPGQVLGDASRKLLKFFAAGEIPINRSLLEERMFSPVLRWLPLPAAWLLAMGIAGLVRLALQDRRWLIVACPIVMAMGTMMLFWAEDRFRFHVMGILALTSGVWIDSMLESLKARRNGNAAVFVGLAALLCVASFAAESTVISQGINWDRIVWGYIKMGKWQDARQLAQRIVSEQPNNGAVLEALGFTAVQAGDFAEAAEDYERAIATRPRSHVAHYNLAKVYLQLGDRRRALDEAQEAHRLYPSSDYQALIQQIGTGP